MHWFWRATISTVLPSLAMGILWGLFFPVLNPIMYWLHKHLGGPGSSGLLVGTLVLAGMLLGVGLFGILARLWPAHPTIGETRCRKCGYILRGISEPRCPECGERI